MSREVLVGSSIDLYCEFYRVDILGNRALVDPSPAPEISIYDALHDPRESSTVDGDALVLSAATTRVTTGIYKYTYTVPAGQMTNWWFDKWVATIDGLAGSAVMQFFVIGTDYGTTPLDSNMLVSIVLSEDITDEDGNPLGEDFEFWFTTTFDPLYSDPILMKLKAGSWIKDVSDETLFLMAYESSKLADDITPVGVFKNEPLFSNARQRFVTADAVLRLLSIPVNSGGMTKQLGDLLVKREGAAFGGMISALSTERDEWYRVVNAGGNIGPGESMPAISVVKGGCDPDRLNAGRRWLTPGQYEMPGANGRMGVYGQRLWKYTIKGGGSRKNEDFT